MGVVVLKNSRPAIAVMSQPDFYIRCRDEGMYVYPNTPDFMIWADSSPYTPIVWTLGPFFLSRREVEFFMGDIEDVGFYYMEEF